MSKCEACRGNGYECEACGHEGEPVPNWFIHPNGYIWDAVNHRQLTFIEAAIYLRTTGHIKDLGEEINSPAKVVQMVKYTDKLLVVLLDNGELWFESSPGVRDHGWLQMTLPPPCEVKS